MREYQSLSHTKWNCKYHIVFIPKRRKKVIFGKLRKHLGQLFHELAKQKDCKIEEGVRRQLPCPVGDNYLDRLTDM
jgi:putative transposase